jgi:hypothetical protein
MVAVARIVVITYMGGAGMTTTSQQRQVLLVLSRQLEEVLELVGKSRPASVLLAQAQWLAANSRETAMATASDWLTKAISDVVNDRLDGIASGFIDPVDGPVFDYLQRQQ